ncbi:alpha/beta hydrolase [Algoriphagus sp. CAU 1675]|uniref:alpha/beta hydrolase n=1 Tax=Algoriphagus sp. CAU 1675 TaxID=3032597 RepID=UPI0023DC7DFF|nr:alpha/beta hydrolase [Algoriphagus sp. CAU 1675]MDF2158814.1 alpha/beta hydrolase [Algoriphagus sp. CAU 1675]
MKKLLEFSYQAHYSLSHEPTFQEREIWLVLHGYGQLAEYFIRKFRDFDNSERLIVAPEGTNYTYLSGFQGRVGANWMTSHEREVAIINNHRFLDTLMEKLLSGFEVQPKINLLGFSQGAATATRWASRWSGRVQRLVLWAGGFAHDLLLENAREKFSETELIMVLGDKDGLITPESIQKQEMFVKSLGKAVETLTFAGGHELDSVILKTLFERE